MVNLFRHNVPAATLLQLLIEAGLFFCAVFIAVKLHRHAAMLTESAVLAPAVVFAVLMVCVNGAFGLYRRDQQLDFVNFVARSIVALFVGFVVAYVAFGALPYGRIFQDVLWFTVLYALAGVVLVHEVLLLPLTRAVFPHRILVVGTGPEARAVEQCLADANQPNLRVMGFYALEQSAAAAAVASHRIVSRGWAIDETAWKLGVHEVVVAVREQRGGVLPLEQLLNCRVSGVRVTDLGSFFERVRGEVPIESLKASWLIYGDGFRQGLLRGLAKRMLDLVTALILLVLAAPIMFLTALAIVRESGFPFIYRQERVGARGEKFMLLKFRSMVPDAESNGEAQWAAVGDARVTRVGRFLRRCAHRRAAAAAERAERRDELRRPAAGAPLLRRGVDPEDPVLRGAPQRQAGDHRLGAGPVLLRRIGRGRGQEAAVRSLLRQEPHVRPRPADPARDGAGCPLRGGRAVTAPPREAAHPSPRAA